MNKIYNRMLGKKYLFKEWFFENVNPKLPKIPTQKPCYPGMSDYCKRCDSDIKIHAHDTGDGWYFFWDCEGQHVSDYQISRSIEDDSLIGWFPFLFGWASRQDLERVGIEEI